MEIRTLERKERETLAELLSGWELAAAWQADWRTFASLSCNPDRTSDAASGPRMRAATQMALRRATADPPRIASDNASSVASSLREARFRIARSRTAKRGSCFR